MESGNNEETLLTSSLLDVHGGSSTVTAAYIFSTAVAACGSFIVGWAGGYSSPTESGILEDLGITKAEFSVFGSISSMGSIVGALVCGKTVDLIGRRGTMWLADVFFLIGWLLIAFAKDCWSLDIGRLAQGLGMGIDSYAVIVYIAEIAPKNNRGRFMSIASLTLCCGIAMVYFVGTIVTWRTLAIIGATPCALQAICLFFVPESPRWLAKVGREKEQEAALRRLRGKTADIALETADIIEYTRSLQQLPKVTLLNLLQRRYAHLLIAGVGLAVLPQLGGMSAIQCYASSILESAEFSSTFGSKAIAVLEIPFALASVVVIDKCGRRPLLMASAAGMGLSSLLIGVSFLLQDLNLLKEVTPILVLIGLLIYSAACALGMLGLPFLILAEIYPIHIKGIAGSLSNFSCCFFTWVVTYTFNFMFDWSSAGTFFFYAIIWGAIIVFAANMIPETKGRQLEEIQASMTPFSH